MPFFSSFVRAAIGRALSLVVVLIALVGGVSWWADRGRPEPYIFQYEGVLGTSLDLTVISTSEAQAGSVEAAVLASIDHDAAILSAWDPASEFSWWMRSSGVPLPASPELIEVLSLFDTWRAQTGGAINPAAEHLSRVWLTAAAENRVPGPSDIEAATAVVQQTHWVIDRSAGTITRTSEAPLALASFTKGYIMERAARAALAAGATGVVINVGGDIVVRGDRTEVVAVRDPRAPADNGALLGQLAIGNRAVASSGGYRRGFDIDGQHYSHILDPRVGRPVAHVLGATVVAADGVVAGALATAFCVLTPEGSAALAAHYPGVEYTLVTAEGREVTSPGWHTLVAPVPPSESVSLPNPFVTLSAAAVQNWDPSFELAVTMNLARPGGRARRPYVAVWIEDASGRHVRTLALWVSRPRWIPDLRAWYRRAQADDVGADTVSSATRAAGEYTLTWDGRNQHGTLVPAGKYTVFIEVVREHGTYQLMRQDVAVGDGPQHFDLGGNVEVTAATVDYRKTGGR